MIRKQRTNAAAPVKYQPQVNVSHGDSERLYLPKREASQMFDLSRCFLENESVLYQ